MNKAAFINRVAAILRESPCYSETKDIGKDALAIADIFAEEIERLETEVCELRNERHRDNINSLSDADFGP